MTTTPLTKRPALRIVLLLACGILASTYVPLSPLTFYFTTLLFALVGFALQLGTRRTLAASISIHVGIVCAGAALYTNELSKSSTEKLVPQGRNELIVLEGTVDAEPVEKGKNLQLVVRTTFIARGPEAAATDRRVLVLAKTSKNKELRERTQIGTSVVVEGLLEDFPGPRNPGEFNYGRYLELDDIDGVVRVNDSGGVRIGGAPQKTSLLSSISTLRRSLAAILDRHHSGEEASYLKGLVLADRGEIPTEVKQSFVDTGTIHILAVSGLHVAVVAMIFYGLFGMLRFPRRLVSIATMAGLIFYMLLTGATPSVVRATIMACVLLAGGLFERKTDIYNSLGIAALIILALDPKQLFNVGFQLSFAAVVSIVYFYPILAQLIRRIPEKFEEIKAIDLVLKLFAVSLAAQLGTLPFTAFYFERISIVSLLANLVVVPISSVNVMLGFATILTSPISNWLAGCYAAVNDLLSSFLLGFVAVAARVPFAFVDVANAGSGFVLLYYVGVGGALSLNRPRVLTRFIIAFLLLLNALLYVDVLRGPDTAFSATFIDVGQGDAMLLEFPNGKRALIDAGPKSFSYDSGEKIIAPFLKRKGVDRLNAMILSHAHADHLGGVEHLLNGFRVEQLIQADTVAHSRLHRELKAAAEMRGVELCRIGAGGRIEIDPTVRLYVLHPYLAEDSLSSLNNESIVLKLVYGETSFLLVGDAEAEAEEKLLLRYGAFLDSDLLKVGHHGSITSSSVEFLKRVTPRTAIISVGRNNKFRHPSPEVVARFQTLGVDIRRTDEGGAVVLRSDGQRIEFVSRR